MKTLLRNLNYFHTDLVCHTMFSDRYLLYWSVRRIVLGSIFRRLSVKTWWTTMWTLRIKYGKWIRFLFTTRVSKGRQRQIMFFFHRTWEWKEVQCWYCLHNANTYKAVYVIKIRIFFKPNLRALRAPYLRHT